jgi:hypothetical protein
MSWSALLCLVFGAAAQAQSPSRGELLYSTHCGACHGTQMHWRQKKLATTWDTLKAQVQRWQGVAGLDWSEAEIEEVARHLNETIYRYPEPARVGGLAPSLLQWSRLTIHCTPKRSVTMPKQLDQKVLPSGISTRPPSASALNARCDSASVG